MNKNAMWGIVAVVVILAIAVIMMTRTNAPEQTSKEQLATIAPEATTSTAATSPAVSGQKSLRDLLTLGTAQQCTFTDGTTKGTVYVSGGKVRSDFTIVEDGKSMTAHTIVRDNTSYFWTDDSTTGFKTTMSEAPQGSTTTAPNPANQSLDVDKKGDYSCGTWVVSESMFTVPSTVTFSDFSQLMQGIKIPQ